MEQQNEHNNIHTGAENKPHIGIFGRCNAGKSTLLNHLTGGDHAVVSATAGTTTDLVRKHFEIDGIGPVVLIDTPGTDDNTEIGPLRSGRAEYALTLVDLAIVVYRRWTSKEDELAAKITAGGIPCIAVLNNFAGHDPTNDIGGRDSKLNEGGDGIRDGQGPADFAVFSPTTCNNGLEDICDRIRKALPARSYSAPSMFAGQVKTGEAVLLVCPIDTGAPAGRMILPQAQAVRELLDNNAVAVVVQPEQAAAVLNSGIRPVLTVCDSQVYSQMRRSLPEDLELTTFSILLASSKGDPQLYGSGLEAIDRLRDGDRILISESCCHTISCEDIGRNKIPRWLTEYTGRNLEFTWISGNSPLPADLGSYSLMIQCGGCVATRTQIRNRIRQAAAAEVPVTNYGMAIRKITFK